MNRVFSGVQPTGSLHLGNYLGALRRFVAMQDSYDCLYCIVDLHGLTAPHDPEGLRSATREVAAGFLAAGIDPRRSVIFNQSRVAMHSRLAWLLACVTPLGWLNRMTSSRRRPARNASRRASVSTAIRCCRLRTSSATTPRMCPWARTRSSIWSCAGTSRAPSNRRFEVDFFPLPEPVITGEEDELTCPRVMSLRDGRVKMSKSDPSDYSRINLTDDRDTIARKLRKARTDSEPGVTYEPDRRPEASNLVAIYAALAGGGRQAVLDEFAGARFSDFKRRLTELAVETLGPVGEGMSRLLADPAEVDAVLRTAPCAPTPSPIRSWPGPRRSWASSILEAGAKRALPCRPGSGGGADGHAHRRCPGQGADRAGRGEPDRGAAPDRRRFRGGGRPCGPGLGRVLLDG